MLVKREIKNEVNLDEKCRLGNTQSFSMDILDRDSLSDYIGVKWKDLDVYIRMAQLVGDDKMFVFYSTDGAHILFVISDAVWDTSGYASGSRTSKSRKFSEAVRDSQEEWEHYRCRANPQTYQVIRERIGLYGRHISLDGVKAHDAFSIPVDVESSQMARKIVILERYIELHDVIATFWACHVVAMIDLKLFQLDHVSSDRDRQTFTYAEQETLTYIEAKKQLHDLKAKRIHVKKESTEVIKARPPQRKRSILKRGVSPKKKNKKNKKVSFAQNVKPEMHPNLTSKNNSNDGYNVMIDPFKAPIFQMLNTSHPVLNEESARMPKLEPDVEESKQTQKPAQQQWGCQSAIDPHGCNVPSKVTQCGSRPHSNRPEGDVSDQQSWNESTSVKKREPEPRFSILGRRVAGFFGDSDELDMPPVKKVKREPHQPKVEMLR